ncbi:acyl-CoA thioesterase [Algiphilus sp.]|uniref:acyl-CoA thioesterase n=1 Tax=Algiphilus sp. TaxID=1872431 RepID=UPI003C46413F
MAEQNERRERYYYWLTIPTRWMDGDPYGHVNNVQYYSFIDTVVTTMLIEKEVLRGPHWNAIGLTIESHCNYHAPISFPDVVEAGLRIGRIGNSSLRYEVGLFRRGDEQPAATGHFVHVFVDPETRRPVPLVEPVRAAMQALTLSGA